MAETISNGGVMLKLLDPYRWAIAAVLAAMLVGGVAWWRYSVIQIVIADSSHGRYVEIKSLTRKPS